MKKSKQRSQQPLGRLEIAVMRVLWGSSAPLSIAAVKEGMSGAPAYTTIMTTLDRLYKKGHVSRRRDGKAYLYRAVSKKESVVETLLRQISQAFFDSDVKALMPHVLGSAKRAVPASRKVPHERNRRNFSR